ncbi:receptor-type tyrosine-protein phosphatase F-like isoform X3 [Pecten maximus]|uniref:receptor-type tyrosine-protein phosphatase F-like isoform X3 n=1 Tax=Pecten maximus TaxID=6579 RepID=UPI001458E1DA|nr:receptor-type tyrosine-protein phosphatase F-like isoform X3 [Pecten maximus]
MRISSVLGVISCLVTLSFSAERAENSSSGSDFYRFTNKIRNPPQITQSPRNQRVAEDSIISFFCKASGNPQPRFQWERDGKRINPKRTRYFIYDMPHGSVLRIEPVKARRDQATFTCIADNGIGEPARANSTLKVYAMNRDKGIPNGYPSITVNPELKAVEKDRQVKMQCEAIARNAEDMGRPHIFWIKDYIPVDMSDPRITIQPTGTLFIERSQESDAGKYECVAENQIGVTYSFAANLYVRVRRVPPHFTISPENKEVDLHTSINMTCVAIGSPMPVVKWRDGPFELNAEDEVSIGKNVLQLLNVTETKNYTCVASSDLGNIEAVAEVRVKAPGTPPRNVHGRPISTTTIIVEWLPPEKPNGIIKGYKIFYTLDPDLPIILWKRHDVNSNDRAATIENLMPNVTYHMCILAYSSKGEGPVSNLIQVMTRQGARTNCSRKTCFSEFVVPLQPKNLHAVAMSPNVIEVTWDPPENHQSVISYKLYFNDSYRRQSAHITIDPPVSRFRLTDLTPNTIYHIQVSAMSEKGEGAHTPTVQVQTRQFAPSGEPQNLSGRPIDSRSIEVTWNPPPPDQQNGDITGYKIFYVKNVPDLSEEDAQSVTVDAAANKLTLANLAVWTEYKIWVLAFTSVGDGPKSQPIIVSTDEDVPGPPKSVRVEVINSTTIFVEWRPPETQRENGIIRGYQVYCVVVDSKNRPKEGTDRISDTTDGNRREAVITNLDPATKYSIKVAGYTRRGDGQRSKEVFVVTSGAVPTIPRNLDVEFLGEDPPQVQVTWQRPRETHGKLAGYKVFWGRRGEKYTLINLGPMHHAYISDILDKGATYEFLVVARNGEGDGVRASQIITTPDGIPDGAPQNFTATGLTETSVRLEWDLPAKKLQNGEIIMYQLVYHKMADPTNTEDLNITGIQYDVHNLEMNTDYVFQVKAYTSQGAGPWTVQHPFHTFGPMLPPPENIKLIRSSPDTILVTWDEPKLPVAGYRVYYNMFELQKMELWQKKDIGPYTVTELTELDTVSVYAVRIQARSVDGRYGNLSEAVVCPVGTSQPITIEVPTNFHVSMRTSVDVTLVWEIPKKPQVTRYTLSYSGVKKYREDNIMQTYHQPRKEEHIHGLTSSFTVENLLPKTKYTFNISAFFQDGVQGGVNSLVVQTRIEAPKEVRRPMVLKISGQEVTVILKPASEENGGLSYYYLVVVPLINTTTKRPEDISNDELTLDISPELPSAKPYIAAKFDAQHLPREFNLGNRDQFGGYANRPLDHGMKYKTFIRAFTVDTKLYKTSPYSETISLSRTPSIPQYPPNTNNPIPQSAEASEKSLLIIMIVAPVCAGVALIIIGCIILIWHMSRRKATRKEKSPEPSSGKVFVDVPPHPCDPVELRRQHYQTPGMISHPPIHIHMLQEHIDNLKNNDNLKFSQEYESIEPGQQFTWDNSNYEVNKPKNRYANVIAYDHSRVILQPIDSVPGSDYVNANYMDGYRKQNAYIATQGPLPETFGDFWRMMWEQRSATIVMMTKLEERSRIKCDQYWPHRGAEHYGLMHVLLVDVTELSTYTIRTFHISRYGFPEKREIRQFQFTAWPDHGVPDHPTPLLMFMRRVKTSNPPDAGPMVVHCSAGVGRTGAFIVIDAMLERIRHEKTVDIYGHVTCLRAQRNYMVQTEDQYIFIHDALLEAVTCGNTEVPARNLSVHIQKLMQPEPGETVTGMELEFKRLANMKASPNRFVSANLPVNKFKNRLVNILPFESTRVALQPIRGVDGSDYINASFIDGYKYCQAYVATQGPLSETTEDFWRMLWEHNSTIIVMLTKLREMGREKCHQYWPSERSARYQYFVVDPMAEYNMPQYILREFKVTDARDGQSRTIRQFQFTDWPEQGVPKSGEGFIDFIGQVHKTKEQFGQEGPISVHCSAGVGRTGVFITLSIVLERMRYEGVVDMFQTVKMLRTQRPAMVQTEDQYQFCYRAALEYLGSFDHYAA